MCLRMLRGILFILIFALSVVLGQWPRHLGKGIFGLFDSAQILRPEKVGEIGSRSWGNWFRFETGYKPFDHRSRIQSQWWVEIDKLVRKWGFHIRFRCKSRPIIKRSLRVFPTQELPTKQQDMGVLRLTKTTIGLWIPFLQHLESSWFNPAMETGFS
jgi:hypothetical protein